MPFNVFTFAVEGASKTESMLDKLLDSVLSPVSVAIIIAVMSYLWNTFTAYKNRRSANRQTFAGLRNEITRIHKQNEKLHTTFKTNLENGVLKKNMEEDSRYYIYIAQGQPSQQVFDTKLRDFSFLSDDCFKILIEYYDTQSLIQACLIDLRSDLFRELNTRRKHDALENISRLFDENLKTYAKCQKAFDRQPARLRPKQRKPDRECRDE